MDDIIDRHRQAEEAKNAARRGGPDEETHAEAVERATAYEAVQADRHQRAEEIIRDIAGRDPHCPYPNSLAGACVEALIREGLL